MRIFYLVVRRQSRVQGCIGFRQFFSIWPNIQFRSNPPSGSSFYSETDLRVRGPFSSESESVASGYRSPATKWKANWINTAFFISLLLGAQWGLGGRVWKKKRSADATVKNLPFCWPFSSCIAGNEAWEQAHLLWWLKPKNPFFLYR